MLQFHSLKGSTLFLEKLLFLWILDFFFKKNQSILSVSGLASSQNLVSQIFMNWSLNFETKRNAIVGNILQVIFLLF